MYDSTMALRAAVVGGSGYTGAELLRLLAGHPDIEVVVVTADSNAGAAVADLYPSLAPAYPSVRYEAATPEDLAGIDVAFLALPHGHSQRLVPDLADTVTHIVDLGADFQASVSGTDVDWDVFVGFNAGDYDANETGLYRYTASDWGGDCATDGAVSLAVGAGPAAAGATRAVGLATGSTGATGLVSVGLVASGLALASPMTAMGVPTGTVSPA